MANPYHDEHGRFCSGDEMKLAIERLENTGHGEQAFQMREEMASIRRQEKAEAIKAKVRGFFNGALGRDEDAPLITTGSELREQWNSRSAYFSAWDKAKLLNAKLLPADVRDEIISTLNFDDRYRILDEWRNNYPRATVHALLAGQEGKQAEEHIWTDEDLYDKAMTFLPERDARQWAGRSAKLADVYWRKYHKRGGSWLSDESFEQKLFEEASKYLEREQLSALAKHSENPQILNSVIELEGVDGEVLAKLAKNPAVDQDLAVALVTRGGAKIGDYRAIRNGLLTNPGTPRDVKRALEKAKWQQEELTPELQAEDQAAFEQARNHYYELLTGSERNKGPYADMEYSELLRKKAEAGDLQTAALGAIYSRKPTFDKLVAKVPSNDQLSDTAEVREYRINLAQSYLQQQADLAAIQSLNLVSTGR